VEEADFFIAAFLELLSSPAVRGEVLDEEQASSDDDGDDESSCF
jgi:hypothetical protein